jgi:hypothetical protein
MPARRRCESRQIDRSGTLSCLHHDDLALVLLGRGRILGDLVGLAAVAFEIVAAHADLVADELVAELEGVEPVGTDRAVPETYDRAAQNALQLVLETFELVQRMGVLDAFADVENGGGKLASLLRRRRSSRSR